MIAGGSATYRLKRAESWSLDAWAAVRPADAFRYIALQPASHGVWRGLRRPLFTAMTLACGVSLVTAGAPSMRIIAPAILYWAYVPLVEVLSLMAVLWRLKTRPPTTVAIDRFFIGRAPVTLFLLALVMTLTSLPFDAWWNILTGPALWAFLVLAPWQGYVDFCCFKHGFGMTSARAAMAVAGHRLLTWLVVFCVFGMVSPTPSSIAEELRAAFVELMR